MKLVMSTSALIGRRPMAVSRFCSHSGDGPFFTPRTRRSAKAGHSDGVVAEIERHRDRAGELRRRPASIARVVERADAGGGEVARDAVDAGAVGRFGVRLISITGSSSPA